MKVGIYQLGQVLLKLEMENEIASDNEDGLCLQGGTFKWYECYLKKKWYAPIKRTAIQDIVSIITSFSSWH